ncbi:MAG: thymidine phosphorylase [Pseudomonadota bacterium]
MLTTEFLAARRDGLPLTPEAIRAFVDGVTSGAVGDPQIAAFTMATCLRPMSDAERVALTQAMRDSGAVLGWDVPGPVLDKHSTGGIGDTVSLMLAPALAACGAYVPMISGRGLGHTGGTLDKLDTIPGYDSTPDLDRLKSVTAEIGCAIVGQTAEIAPADRRLYAVRDVTATVESIDLICASILSKKLAAGLGGLVLDVKTGSGAFLAKVEAARALARVLVDVATGAGCPTAALLTDMDAPLAPAAGNAIEVRLAIDFLTGAEIDGRLWDVTVALGGEALALGGLANGPEAGRAQIAEAFESGSAAEIFGRMVTALGGPSDLLSAPDRHLARAPVVEEITVDDPGFVSAVDTRALGLAVIELGGGRRNATDAIDPAVGLDWLAGTGAHVDAETPLARVHAADSDTLARATERVRAAYKIEPTPPEDKPLILERVG